MNWFLANRSDLARHISYCERGGTHGHRLLAIPSRERLARLIAYLLDEREFLSPLVSGLYLVITRPIRSRYTFKVSIK